MQRFVSYVTIIAGIALANPGARADGGETGASPSHTQSYGNAYHSYYSPYVPAHPIDHGSYAYRGRHLYYY